MGYLIFVLLGFIMVLNMLIGVLVQVVGVVATVEAETNQLTDVKRILMQSRGGLSAEDAITTEDLLDHSLVVFRDRREIKLHDFWRLAVQLRGNVTTTVKDLVSMRQFIHSQLSRLTADVAHLKAMSGQPVAINRSSLLP